MVRIITPKAKFIFNLLPPVIHELPIIITFAILSRVWFIYTGDKNYEWTEIVSSIGVWCLYTYLISASIYYFKSKWLRRIWYFILFSIYAFSVFIWYNFNMELGPAPLLLIVETDSREAKEFLETFLFSNASIQSYVKVGIFIIISYLLETTHRRFLLKKFNLEDRHIFSSLVLSCFIFLGIYECRSYLSYFNLSDEDTLDKISIPADDIYSRTLTAPCAILSAGKTIKKAIRVSIHTESVKTALSNSDSLSIILVIGESYSKSHAQIYGYGHHTTPKMFIHKKKGNLFTFDKVVTPYSTTSPAIKNMLSCNSFSEGEKWYDYPYFPTLFKKAGYNVYMWDNQRYEGRGALIDFTMNSYLHNDSLAKLSYTMDNNEPYIYDGPLYENFKQMVDLDSSPHNLTIFHLLGQHIAYSSRYPKEKEFIRFNSADFERSEPYLDERKLQDIADYDNATLYNDYVIGQIINHFSEKNAVLIYLADHGEEIYDYRDYKGHRSSETPNRQILKYQYDIPFVIWCSNKFKQNYPETVLSIQNAINKPFSSDNLCQLMFHLGAIQTKYYHQERDILSPKYKPGKRYITDQRIDYDSVK